jgi:hypothetical protein
VLAQLREKECGDGVAIGERRQTNVDGHGSLAAEGSLSFRSASIPVQVAKKGLATVRETTGPRDFSTDRPTLSIMEKVNLAEKFAASPSTGVRRSSGT